MALFAIRYRRGAEVVTSLLTSCRTTQYRPESMYPYGLLRQLGVRRRALAYASCMMVTTIASSYGAGCSTKPSESGSTGQPGPSGGGGAEGVGGHDAGLDGPEGDGGDAGDSGDAGPAPPGAQLPFLTYEAEDGETNASVVPATIHLPPPDGSVQPEDEASGRRFVKLTNTGDYVQFKVIAQANTIVIRNSVPDAPNGGGLTTTLSVYLNGQLQKVTLSSVHSWLYGANMNGDSNNPQGGNPHRFWDEARAFIPGVKPGDTVRLQKDADDDDAFHDIDFIDLEQVDDPLPEPPGAVSVVDDPECGTQQGGLPNEYYICAKNDKSAHCPQPGSPTQNLDVCVGKASAQGRVLWFPQGTFHQSARIPLPGNVTVQGAGMWHTTLTAPPFPAGDWAGNQGFKIAGPNVHVADLGIDSDATNRGASGHGFISGSSPDGWTIERVWIQHTGTGMWLGNVKNGLIRDVRVRNTYADGINLNAGSSVVTIQNSHFRNTGDDAIADFSSYDQAKGWPANDQLLIESNTIVQPWWAHGIAIYGGTNQVVRNNLVVDIAKFPGIVVGVYYSAPTPNLPAGILSYGVDSAVVEKNRFVRCGGRGWGQVYPAVKLAPLMGYIHGTTLSQNEIVSSMFSGIEVQDGESQASFEGNLVDGSINTTAGTKGIWIRSGAKGTGVFSANEVKNLNPGQSAFVDDAADAGADGGYAVTQTENNF